MGGAFHLNTLLFCPMVTIKFLRKDSTHVPAGFHDITISEKAMDVVHDFTHFEQAHILSWERLL